MGWGPTWTKKGKAQLPARAHRLTSLSPSLPLSPKPLSMSSDEGNENALTSSASNTRSLPWVSQCDLSQVSDVALLCAMGHSDCGRGGGTTSAALEGPRRCCRPPCTTCLRACLVPAISHQNITFAKNRLGKKCGRMGKGVPFLGTPGHLCSKHQSCDQGAGSPLPPEPTGGGLQPFT